MTPLRRQARRVTPVGWSLAAIIALSLGSVSCGKEDRTAPDGPVATAESSQPNLLTLERGAVITSRTGELRLDASALLAIDEDALSAWVTPPKDPAQTMVIALPTSSRIDQIGVAIVRGESPRAVRFESSTDGETFVPLGTIEVTDPASPAFLNVTPSVVSTLRVTIEEESEKTVALAMLSASGTEAAPYVRPVLNGTWRISGVQATFAQEGTRVVGTLATDPPTHIDGAWANRTIRFIYGRGNEIGLGAISVSPDGQFLNGMPWYHIITPIHVAPVWFGERVGDDSQVGDIRVRDLWLDREGSVALFGISFDEDGGVREDESEETLGWLTDQLSRSGERGFSIVRRVLEPGETDPARVRAKAQLDSLRSVLAARGVDVARVPFEVMGTEGLDHIPQKRLEREMLTSVVLRANRANQKAR